MQDKLEFANVTTETPARPALRAPPVKQAPMVLRVLTETKVMMAYLATCHQYHWIRLANAFHAHMDLKDPTGQKAQMALQVQKDPMAKVVRPAPMAKPDLMVMQDLQEPTENQVNQVPKVTKAPMVRKENREALDLRARKDQQVHQVQLAQLVKKPKLVQTVKQEIKVRMVKEVNQDRKDHLAPMANPEAQAKTPPIARAQNEAKLIKQKIQSFHYVDFIVLTLTIIRLVDSKNI